MKNITELSTLLDAHEYNEFLTMTLSYDSTSDMISEMYNFVHTRYSGSYYKYSILPKSTAFKNATNLNAGSKDLFFSIDATSSDMTIPLDPAIPFKGLNCYQLTADDVLPIEIVLNNNKVFEDTKFPITCRSRIDNSLIFNLNVDVLNTHGQHFNTNDTNYYSFFYSHVYETNKKYYDDVVSKFNQEELNVYMDNSKLIFPKSFYNIVNTLKLNGDSTVPCDISQNLLSVEWDLNSSYLTKLCTIIIDTSFTKLNNMCLNYYNDDINVALVQEEYPTLISPFTISNRKLAHYFGNSSIVRYHYNNDEHHIPMSVQLYNNFFGELDIEGDDISVSPSSIFAQNNPHIFRNGSFIRFSNFSEKIYLKKPTVPKGEDQQGEGEGEGSDISIGNTTITDDIISLIDLDIEYVSPPDTTSTEPPAEESLPPEPEPS